jgi:hypothetical protein
MNEKIICISFSLVIVFLFSLYFKNTYMDSTYEKIKHQKYDWYWFRVFKIAETKANFIKMQRGISVFVLTINIVYIVVVLLR